MNTISGGQAGGISGSGGVGVISVDYGTRPLAAKSDKLAEIPEKYGMPPAEMISKLDRGRGVKLDYVGHADITLLLIEVDPTWTCTIAGDHGVPTIIERGDDACIFGTMTIHGKTLPCMGSAKKGKSDLHKELYGDMLRNGAMRFGIGTKLWSKNRDEGGEDATPTGINPMQLRMSIGRIVGKLPSNVLDVVREVIKSKFNGATTLAEVPDDKLLELSELVSSSMLDSLVVTE